jgi:GNAT superfamily N-acetyltransferase
VREEDLPVLLPLLRGYCDFYKASPTDAELLSLSRALIADPQAEGIQLLARDGAGGPLGFATVYWTWQTLAASRLAVMNDLFVAPGARGSRLADALIEACRDAAREHGATTLWWQTARDNERAQAVYERIGAQRAQWLDYSLAV